jgi:hypothetical protein
MQQNATMQQTRQTDQQRKVLGRDRPWDGPARFDRRPTLRKTRRDPQSQLALRFPPEYDRENPLADLFREPHGQRL